jgi:D-glycero-alpha-D-manno-heptose-7-phosphate kinase
VKITASVPMRIDFAGSTLDVYPLYLFEGGGLTLNAAINVMATASLETRSDRRVVIRSTDLETIEQIDCLDMMVFGGRLDLVKRALAYFRPESGLDITISSQAPTGSGLGASSALLMALAHCLNKLTNRNLTSEQIIDLGANIEAQVIRIPTGKQDYFPPVFGGVCAMWFDIDGWRFENLSTSSALVQGLNERLIVSYTGLPHDSAVTNWAMLKCYIENEGNTVARMRDIRSIAIEMRACLLALDFNRFTDLIAQEWELRRGLAQGVTNPDIERVMATAQNAGALASKICGAGGGGCMITFAEPQAVLTIRQALISAGVRVLPARVVTEGLSWL